MGLSRLLLTATSLSPVRVSRDTLLRLLGEGVGPSGVVETFEHDGDAREPARLHAVFASRTRGRARGLRGTILFVHGKGGAGAEWWRDARRALSCGYDVLIPELRGHRPSGGERITYGLLETGDLRSLLDTAVERFGIAPDRIGLDGCSMGALVSLHLARGNPSIAALWLQSPFADLPRMARHYLHRATGVPQSLMTLPAYLVVKEIERQTSFRLSELDPILAAKEVDCPTTLVHGEADALVPVDWSQPLFEALAGPKTLWRVARCGHCHHPDEPQAIRGGEYVRRWTAFFREHLGGDRR